MGVLRKDYILDRWVYYATKRKKRPIEFKEVGSSIKSYNCSFCPGNERLTPPEIGRIKSKTKWKVRWFPNKYPAVKLEGNENIYSKNKFLKEGKTYGMHEIIVETSNHKKQLWDLSVDDIKEIFEIYSSRVKELSKLKGIKYVAIFKNHGSQGGTSLSHSHTQVTAILILPQQVKEEINAAKKFKKCPYCNVIRLESKGKRKIIENKNIIAFCPYASRFNFEAWIFPKKHVKNMISMTSEELYDMAAALKKILANLKKLNASYNFFLHYAPKGNDLHFHVEVTPRYAKWGGFEISTGAVINSVMPEDAARFYRG